jgi:hypothetical protein
MNGYDTIKYNIVSKKSGERRDLMGERAKCQSSYSRVRLALRSRSDSSSGEKVTISICVFISRNIKTSQHQI